MSVVRASHEPGKTAAPTPADRERLRAEAARLAEEHHRVSAARGAGCGDGDDLDAARRALGGRA